MKTENSTKTWLEIELPIVSSRISPIEYRKCTVKSRYIDARQMFGYFMQHFMRCRGLLGVPIIYIQICNYCIFVWCLNSKNCFFLFFFIYIREVYIFLKFIHFFLSKICKCLLICCSAVTRRREKENEIYLFCAKMKKKPTMFNVIKIHKPDGIKHLDVKTFSCTFVRCDFCKQSSLSKPQIKVSVP